METILKLLNVSKSLGKKKVIDNISFDVFAGEVFGFLGPNGAGKTTTIKMITGFLSIEEGNIHINGYNLKKKYKKAMSFIGGIVENPEMYKDLSGLTNLQMYARLHKGVTKQRIDEVVRIVGLQNHIKEKIKKYSLGMKQRCGLAQAILHKPKLLILDEPTNGLDPAGIRELRDILKKLAYEENIAVFISSHLLSEMELMCDRVAIINTGRILSVKSIKELLLDKEGTERPIIHRFELKPVDKALKVLESSFKGLIKEIEKEYIDLEVAKYKVPELITLLAVSGIEIFSVNKIESSLEDVFMELTGGGNEIA